MIKVDVKELKELQKRINALSSDHILSDITNEAGQRLYAKVVKRTPVGKKPTFKQFSNGGKKSQSIKGEHGKKKSFLTRQGADYEKYWGGYQGGSLRKSWSIKPVEQTAKGYEITISNPMEYASFVEYGHTQRIGRYVPQINKKLKRGWVEGQFFLTKSEIEIEREIPRLFNAKIQQVLNEVMNDK